MASWFGDGGLTQYQASQQALTPAHDHPWGSFAADFALLGASHVSAQMTFDHHPVPPVSRVFLFPFILTQSTCDEN